MGFLNKESIKGAPPSADFSYPLPDAKSAISFAYPLDREKIRAFLRKDLPNGRVDHETDNIKTYLNGFRAGIKVRNFLRDKGYKAEAIFPNFKNRKNVKSWQIRMYPTVSMRYLAARSGVGLYGWSGNLGLKGYGAAIILGGVTTTAELEPTNPLPKEETFCNNCKLCEKVCPLRMFGGDDKEEFVDIGEYRFTFSKRNHLYRCFTSCGGFSGLDKTGKWSTWSTGRYPYPETKEEVIDVLARSVRNKFKWYIKDEPEGYNVDTLKDDLEVTKSELKEAMKDNKKSLKQLKGTTLTCGNCQLICWGDPKETAENYKILVNSGCVIERKSGEVAVLPPDEAKKEFDTMGGKNKTSLFYKLVARIARKYLKVVDRKYFDRTNYEEK